MIIVQPMVQMHGVLREKTCSPILLLLFFEQGSGRMHHFGKRKIYISVYIAFWKKKKLEITQIKIREGSKGVRTPF